jgi:signal transduction histidine kinase
MLVAMAAVTALAYWDEQRESKAALNDFAHEQVTLAESLAASLEQRLDTGGPPNELVRMPPAELLAAVKGIEQKGVVRVLVARPGESDLAGSDGSGVVATAISRAFANGMSSVRLSRSEAAALGLPARTAIAGLAHASIGRLGHWGVAVVATAQAERDREMRAQWRLVLGVLVASGLVLAFGGFAMSKQRKELELGHELELRRVRTERDERLVRADKLATMGALASGVAHEVSTPLGVILGRAEQLLPKQPDERARHAVETITQQTERIFSVIRGFLALARGARPALERRDPSALAGAATGLVEHRFEQSRIGLDVRIQPDLPQVACDTRLFEQVLVNLLLNACDASSAGGRVTLSVEADRGQVAFVVADEGAGISPEVAERATEPFFTTKPEGQGTGLGLAIANEIVKHHRGTLALRSNGQGRGTRATVELPAAGKDEHA